MHLIGRHYVIISTCYREPTPVYKVGKYRIQEISDEFIPPILNLKWLDEVIDVVDGDAIIMAQKLASELGLGVGISSGANLLGAQLVQEKLGSDAVVVTVFLDDNKKYLSTDLLREEPVRTDYLAPRIKLLRVAALKGVCTTCCNPEECLENISLDKDALKTLPHCPLR